MRNFALAFVLLCGCGPGGGGTERCTGSDCGDGPRIKLSPQGEFGHIVCNDEAHECRLDFGALQPGATAESWTVIENVGNERLHLAELSVTEPSFEVRHPEVELDPGESLSFRLRIRIDSENQERSGELHFLSDARNGEPAEQGCSMMANGCSLVRVALNASTFR